MGRRGGGLGGGVDRRHLVLVRLALVSGVNARCVRLAHRHSLPLPQATLVAEASAQFESLSAQVRAGDEASAKLQPLEEQIKAANDKYLRVKALF